MAFIYYFSEFSLLEGQIFRNLISLVNEVAPIHQVHRDWCKDWNITFPIEHCRWLCPQQTESEPFLPGAQACLDLSSLGHEHGFLDEYVY